ncbi:DUF1080 domain-containing protein [Candidatus Sumerlaeota bacterium]|nr:DUF1080 domain-containing protein [Candidatus Sumerlaeota bacterium]
MNKCGRIMLSVVCVIAMAATALALQAEPVGAAKKARKGAKAGEQKKAAIDLFNGKDLTGWEPVGKADWKVVDGLLVGKQGADNAPGDLLTKESFSDFEAVLTYKCTWPCNSGLWFRYQSPKLAYQADILEYVKPEAYSGTLYSPGYPGGGKTFMAINLDKTIEKRDDWNTLRVVAQGDNIQIFLNGKKTADVRDKHVSEGKLGFQVHPGAQFGPMSITVKELKLRPLEPTK